MDRPDITDVVFLRMHRNHSQRQPVQGSTARLRPTISSFTRAHAAVLARLPATCRDFTLFRRDKAVSRLRARDGVTYRYLLWFRLQDSFWSPHQLGGTCYLAELALFARRNARPQAQAWRGPMAAKVRFELCGIVHAIMLTVEF